MIDLHSHILPGLDDGSPNLAGSLAMARMAVADGITHLACTPHITPGIYDLAVGAIASALLNLRRALDEEAIPLVLMLGADVHMDPALAPKLRSGDVPTINGSRYFLFEPPRQVAPPRIVDAVQSIVESGFIPVLTHPERLKWIESHYRTVVSVIDAGALVQLTAGSITGHFGRRPRYWSERLLDEGRVDVIASDAHNATSRPPILSGEIAQLHVGDVREVHDIWIMHVTTEGEGAKRTKTKGSMRVVPLHSELIRLGFLDYCQSMRKRDERQAFPEVDIPEMGQIAAQFSREFNRYLAKVGIKTDTSIVTYSLRHTFIDRARRAGFMDDEIGLIVGHDKPSTTGRYGVEKPGVLRRRLEIVEGVQYAGLGDPPGAGT